MRTLTAPGCSGGSELFDALSRGVGRSPEHVAEAALQLAIERMAAAIRRVSLHRGQDIRGGVLVAYGGASGQHACRLADELGLQSVLFHPLAGVLSAYGMGQARQSCRLQHHVGAQLSPDWLTTLPGQITKLVEQARLRLQQQGDIKEATEGCAIHVRLDLRYPGADQPWPWPGARSRL